MSNILNFDSERNSEFIKDETKAYNDYLKDPQTGKRELKKAGLLHPRYWNAKDFREYYEENEKKCGKAEAWERLYQKILERDEEEETVEVDGLLFS